jgi:hypothetical protein
MSRMLADLVSRMQRLIDLDSAFTPELFTQYRYVNGPERCCHRLVQQLIRQAGREMEGVIPSANEKQLGTSPRWRPDVVLRNSAGQLLGVVEYESLNSSDSRVVEKDFYGYESWADRLPKPVPLLVITTLPDGQDSQYRLLYKQNDAYNIDHAANEATIRQNPFHYWYAFYRRWLEHRIVSKSLPVRFANFSGNRLTFFRSWPVPAAPYQPALADGSDCSKKWGEPEAVRELRVACKRKLWRQTRVEALKETLRKFWFEEQRLHGSEHWDSRAEASFLRAVDRVQNRQEACRVIEKVQWNMY